MKVLILGRQEEIPAFHEPTGDLTVIRCDDGHSIPKDPAQVDVIAGCGDFSPGSSLTDAMLGWRAHPHTYLIPCWFLAEKNALEKNCIWPRLAIDRFDLDFGAGSLSEWLPAVSEWQQNRMHFKNSGSLEDRSPLELATSLCLRRASGLLSVVDEEGAEGSYLFRDGNLITASLEHLRGAEAFYELLCMSRGWYTWESKTNPAGGDADPQSVSRLITSGLQRIQGANLLYHFIPDFDCLVTKTESQSALDDSATDSFPEQKKVHALVDGHVSVSQIIMASPLSRPSTMTLLAEWFSLGDIETPVMNSGPRCRVLVVDDSPLICRALRTIFEEDPRLELAGIAHDGEEALRLIGRQKPDVVTLDLQMPKMDGLTTLKHILIGDPRPVVVLSAFTKETSRSTYESFKYGAVDVISKPSNGASAPAGGSRGRELCDRVVQASNVQLGAVRYIRNRKKSAAGRLQPPVPDEPAGSFDRTVIVLCGAGGFPSLLKLMFGMPDSGSIPTVVVATAMPGHVVEALVSHIKEETPVAIEEISGPRTLIPGVCHFISDASCRHLLRDDQAVRIARNENGPEATGFFDELLASASESFKSRLTAVLISGTGEDGVEGMRRVRESGGTGFALSPAACLKPELPRKIIDLGYASEITSEGVFKWA